MDVVIAAADGFTYDGTNPWTANACCHNDVPLAQADISNAVTELHVDKTLGEKVFDVTALVQGWIDGASTNNGVVLVPDAGSAFANSRSADYGDSALHPQLVVTYE